jgi:gliding motility-associated lipoprotein GldH
MISIKKNLFFYFIILLITVLSACSSVDLYEKTAVIPGHDWQRTFKPEFTFTIRDTASPYEIFLVLRHNEKYNYNNIYINLYTQQPGMDSVQKERFDLTLAIGDQGWQASGMDDIYEHRIKLTPADRDLYFPRTGNYTFIVEQVMREDPLQNVMNVGLRIEKKK